MNCLKVKCVALTFDDGPGPYTARLLKDLAAYGAHATFFTVGQNVAANPLLVRAELAAGHEVGNHTWSHLNLATADPAAQKSQIGRCDRALLAATGLAPTLIRPPYGAVNPKFKAWVNRPLILWDVDTLDWKFRNSARVRRAATAGTRPGDIILMHDIHPTTVAAVPGILKVLSRRGYHFVTVTELMAGTPLKAGRIYGANPQAFGR